jgi:hypothetical protein
MKLNQEEEVRPELSFYKEEWPKHYYEIKDIDDRETLLNEVLNNNPSSPDDLRRKEILRQRYREPSVKGNRKDFFMEAWMFLVIDGKTSFNFFNKKFLTKRFMNDYIQLGIDLGNEPDRFLLDEWNDFADLLIRANSSDKSYGSLAFGMMKMSDKNLSKKMAEEINEATLYIPEEIGISDALQPLRSIMIRKYLDLVPNGSAYINL